MCGKIVGVLRWWVGVGGKFMGAVMWWVSGCVVRLWVW